MTYDWGVRDELKTQKSQKRIDRNRQNVGDSLIRTQGTQIRRKIWLHSVQGVFVKGTQKIS